MIYLIVSFFIICFSYELLYFSFGEAVLMGLSCCLSFIYLKDWYVRVTHTTSFFNNHGKRIFLYILPFTTVLLYLATLRTVASYDVVDAGSYILFYILLGITWQFVSLQGMFLFLDFSYQDDALSGRNLPALVTFSFAYLGLSFVYAAANIGDGPGWWTVVFAGCLGTLTWLLIGRIVNKITGIVERIVMDKELNSGIRFGSFLLANGIILGHASSGDWTSFSVTAIEFLVGWPAIPLALLMILLEKSMFRIHEEWEEEHNTKGKTIVVSVFYVVCSVVAVLLVPPVI